MPAFPAAVRLEELDWEDHRFAIRTFLPPSRLPASLSQFGILIPLWVWLRHHRKYTVVDGFKRLEWAKETGVEAIPCVVFPETSSYEQLLVLRAEGKLFGPPLNAAEKAQLIAKLAQTMPHRYLADHILPPLGIPRREDAIGRWCRLSEAGTTLLEAVASGMICERTALELAAWDEAERTETLVVLKELRCSASIQMEIVERVAEIALRGDMPRLAILRRPELQSILQDQRWNHRQKTEAVRSLLTRFRFPRLHARAERFNRDWQAASLPGAIRLTPPPAFEGDRWQLQVTFSAPQELQDLLTTATDFARSSLLKSLISTANPD